MGNKIKKEIYSAVKRVLESGVFINGKEVELFEKEFAEFCKTKYAVSVNSGTDALFLSLKALGIKKGDEVITTPFTFIATAEVIANLGAEPVFVDIKPRTFNMDCSKIEKAITKRTKAIIPVHLFGQMAEMDKIMAIAQKHKLHVVEDAAQAAGAKMKTKTAGSIGDSGCFSFFPSKNLGCLGDGGMIATNNKNLAEKLKLLKNHGSSPKDKYINLILGINSRLDAMQAAVLRTKMRYLNAWNKKRRDIAKDYIKNLKGINGIILPEISEGCVFNQFAIRAENRDGLKRYLEKKGIEAKIYYPLPLHLQPAFRYLGHRKGDFPISEKTAKQVLALPIYPELSRQKQILTIKCIKDFYEKKN